MNNTVHENEKPFECFECFLNRHIETLHEKKEPFQCSQCQYWVGCKDHLTKHIAAVHEKNNVLSKNIEQQIVDVPEKKPTVIFTVKAGDNNPMKDLALLKRPDKCKNNADVRGNKKAFECSLCPYKTAGKCQLNKHIAAVHEKKKPFLCSMCLSKFGWKFALTKHMYTVHEKKKQLVQRPFVCSMCRSNFAQKGN